MSLSKYVTASDARINVPLISVLGNRWSPSYFCSLTALFHLIWSQGQDLHDDVQTVAECTAWQGKQTCYVSLSLYSSFHIYLKPTISLTLERDSSYIKLMWPGTSSFIICVVYIMCSPCAPKNCGILFISVTATSLASPVMTRTMFPPMMTSTQWGEFACTEASPTVATIKKKKKKKTNDLTGQIRKLQYNKWVHNKLQSHGQSLTSISTHSSPPR